MNNDYLKYIVDLGKLTSIQYRCLFLLNTGEYTQAELGRILETDRANINRAVKALENLGLIETIYQSGSNIYLKAIEPEKVLANIGLNNKEIIEKKVAELGYKIGCWDNNIEKLSRLNLNKVLRYLEEEYTDVLVDVDREKYIVEIATVDNEKDLNMLSDKSYESQYGRKFEED